ncbi:MAG: hypothetical protein V1860_03605 [bacterium]
MKTTAGTAGQAGAGFATVEVIGRPIIFLSGEEFFDACLKILFRRQVWFLDGWHIIYGNRKNSLPQLEIRLEFENERILVVFFEPGKILGLSLTASEFSRVIVIMDGPLSIADEAELSMAGRVLTRQGKKLGIINDPLLPQKFSCYISSDDKEKMIENFCSELARGLNASLCSFYSPNPKGDWQ